MKNMTQKRQSGKTRGTEWQRGSNKGTRKMKKQFIKRMAEKLRKILCTRLHKEICRFAACGRRRLVNENRKKFSFAGINLVGMLVLPLLCAFFLGKNAGEKEAIEKIQVAAAEEMAAKTEEMPYHEIRIVDDSPGQETDTEGGAQHPPTDTAEEDTGYKDSILLVNKDHPLPADYRAGRLLTLPDGVNRAAEEAYEPLCDMLEAGRKEGLSFEICSSYRDVERQRELFEEDVAMLMRRGYTYGEAYDKVAEETMPPGCSEHSTGLAFDIVALGYQMLDAGQERTAENQWLQEHCAEYGFILRYPKGKEDITAISYESWHFRYVGKEAAEHIMAEGITLEEYLLTEQ